MLNVEFLGWDFDRERDLDEAFVGVLCSVPELALFDGSHEAEDFL